MSKFVFCYPNGHRAVQGVFDLTEEQAKRKAAKLSLEKKRVIVLKSMYLIYETERYHGHNLSGLDMPIDHGFEPVYSFKNGKIDRRYE